MTRPSEAAVRIAMRVMPSTIPDQTELGAALRLGEDRLRGELVERLLNALGLTCEMAEELISSGIVANDPICVPA